MASITLSGKQVKAFVKALESAFNPNEFDAMMQFYLDEKRTSFSLADDLPERFRETINKFQNRGWTSKLIAAALNANPDNPQLKAFARDLGLNPVPDDQAANLEQIVTERSRFKKAVTFVDQMTNRINWICRVVVPNGGGTGVLVADDLVLTNYHVMSKVISKEIPLSQISCTFDFLKLNSGAELSSGRSVPLHADGVIASQPYSPRDVNPDGGEPLASDLDYAILRLAEPVGTQPIGTNGESNGATQERGHLAISSNAPLVAINDPLFVLQHPLLPDHAIQEPVQVAIGKVLESPFKELRVRHDARTLGGSSGSPCFNADLEMVALHHAGDSNLSWKKPLWNQAIPVGRIIADLAARGVPKFWLD